MLYDKVKPQYADLKKPKHQFAQVYAIDIWRTGECKMYQVGTSDKMLLRVLCVLRAQMVSCPVHVQVRCA